MYGPELTKKLPHFESLKINLYPGAIGGALLGASLLHNLRTRRPPSAHMLKHVLAVGAGFFIGNQVEQLIEDRRNLRVRVIEDYISLHPEDFPVTEPKKYKDLLLKWYPCR